MRYLKKHDNGAAVDALMTAPDIDGQIAYNETMSGFNFHRNRLSLSAVAEQVLRYAQFPKAPAVAAQSALIRDCLPAFAAENSLKVLDDSVLPRIWLGNRISTPAHVDEWNNIACVVAGRRRFTLFPPEQIANLYIGPLDFAPTGAAMSLVSLRNPDFDKHPKFRDALAALRERRTGTGRRHIHSAAMVAPRRIARAVQCAGELLVARQLWRRSESRFRFRCAASRHPEHPRPAAADPPSLGRLLRALCVRRAERGDGAHTPGAAWNPFRSERRATGSAACALDKEVESLTGQSESARQAAAGRFREISPPGCLPPGSAISLPA